MSAALGACSDISTTPLPGALPESATTSTATATTLPQITLDGITITVVLPPASSSVAVTETASMTNPSGTTPLSRGRSVIGAGPATSTPFAYLAFTPASSTTLSGLPTMSFYAGPGSAPLLRSATAWAALASELNDFYAAYPAPTLSGNVLTFAGGAMPVSISPTAPLVIALYNTAG